MKIGVNLNLDLNKIDESRIKVVGGARYIDLSTFINIDSVGQYGDNGTISQSISKDERDGGVQMPICGNSKVFWRDDGQPVVKKEDAPQPNAYQQNFQQQAPPQQAPQAAPQQAPPQAAPQNFDAVIAEYTRAGQVLRDELWPNYTDAQREAIINALTPA
ncbi:MAG: hypothetical protein V3R25_10025 [Nitrosomonadaceae bacterium]